MTGVAELLGAAAMAAAFAALGWRQGDRSDVVIALLLALALAVLLVLNRPPEGLGLVMIGGLELLGAGLLAVLMMDAFSAPLPIVRRIPILRRRAERRFDEAFHRQLVGFWTLAHSQSSPAEIRSIGRQMRQLRAPTQRWADLRENYAAVLDAQSDYVEAGARDPSREAEFERQLAELAERCAVLRAAYEAPART